LKKIIVFVSWNNEKKEGKEEKEEDEVMAEWLTIMFDFVIIN
jgi:hypothetical protein